ncbi:hypothetical protein ACFPYI_15015 [Halomarina salina]|uniref:Uncharacterized protein n=1 Tax=Halomarina salina TaxID=1872699 RepID=A0ABD5RQD8_9EURY|nr:hypothetical protein [Halomarina salina]
MIPLSLGLVFSLAYFEYPGELLIYGSIEAGWQAQLTITSLSFVVLIFLLEQINRSRYREGVLRSFLSSSRVMPVLYYTLSASVILTYLTYYHSPENSQPLFLDATFFFLVGTIVAIGYVYYRAVRLVFSDLLEKLTIQQINKGIRLRAMDRERVQNSESIIRDRLPESVHVNNPPIRADPNQTVRSYDANETGLDGYVVDIDIDRLSTAISQAKDSLGESDDLFVNLKLGLEMQRGINLLSVYSDSTIAPSIPSEVIESTQEAIYCSKSLPWKTGDSIVEKNMSHISEETRRAITESNPVEVEANLERYSLLLESALELEQGSFVNSDEASKIVDGHVDSILREIYRIIEAVAESGVTEIVTAVRAEIFRFALKFHRRREPSRFQRTVGLYNSFYRNLSANPNVDSEALRSLLYSVDNLSTSIFASLKDADTPKDAESVGKNIADFYEVVDDMLRSALQLGDGETFNNLWELGQIGSYRVSDYRGIIDRTSAEYDQELRSSLVTLVHELSNDTISQIQDQGENSGGEDLLGRLPDFPKLVRLQNRLITAEIQIEVAQSIRDNFKKIQFVAASHAYRMQQVGDLEPTEFSKICQTSLSQYDVHGLIDGYTLAISKAPHGMSKWNWNDSNAFKNAWVEMPSDDEVLGEFFCYMMLILIDPDEYELDGITEYNNPLAEVEPKERKPPNLRSIISNIEKEDIAVELLSSADKFEFEERRRILQVMNTNARKILKERNRKAIADADIDDDLVAEFRDTYEEEFCQRFILRTVLDDLGQLNVVEYDKDTSPLPSGYSVNYPKIAFLPNHEVITHIGRDAQSHADTITSAWISDNRDNINEVEMDPEKPLPEKIAEVVRSEPANPNDSHALILSGVRARAAVRDSDYFQRGDGSTADSGVFTVDNNEIPTYYGGVEKYDFLLLIGELSALELVEYRNNGQVVDIEVDAISHESNSGDDSDRSEDNIIDRGQYVHLQIKHYAEFSTTSYFAVGGKVD